MPTETSITCPEFTFYVLCALFACPLGIFKVLLELFMSWVQFVCPVFTCYVLCVLVSVLCALVLSCVQFYVLRALSMSCVHFNVLCALFMS